MKLTAVQVGETNAYFIQNAGGVVLVDAGPIGAEKKLIPAAEAAGIRPEMVKLIFITHGHLDHYGAAAAMQAWCKAPITAHPLAPAFSERKRNALPPAQTLRSSVVRLIYLLLTPFMRHAPLHADLELDEGDSLTEYGLEADLVRLPGHSPDTMGMITADGDAFVGDLLVNYGPPSRPLYMHNETDWQASYERLAKLTPRTVYVGHGDPIPGDQLSSIYPARYQWRWWVR